MRVPGPSSGVWTAVDVPLGGGGPMAAGDPGIGIDPLTSGDGGGSWAPIGVMAALLDPGTSPGGPRPSPDWVAAC